jgi:hypothetical protein
MYERRPLNTEQAAEYLAEKLGLARLSPRTLEGWRHRRSGPQFCRFAGRVLYQPLELDDFVRRTLIGESERP